MLVLGMMFGDRAVALVLRAMSLKLGWQGVDCRLSWHVNIEHLEEGGMGSKDVAPLECGVVSRFEMSQGCAELRKKNSVVDRCVAVATEEFVSRAGQIAVEIWASRDSVRSLHCEQDKMCETFENYVHMLGTCPQKNAALGLHRRRGHAQTHRGSPRTTSPPSEFVLPAVGSQFTMTAKRQ